ncbi:glycoside hydrolase family 30 protein [Collinsella tanakaei]|uniref:glycoside hydrolase family 30 protein n=1 Tax=Collinsella tanakaei TaxID=626935 RepID=UPI0025A36894|nr:glycoside hydrolase family 30 beta sandwich domain-containing protein [Collinsella tanakaei]MDM8301007.1 glycoside hydrolase family 30 beta sandwich domain-containing protein [Collinsella tanakaei]
MRSYMTTGDGQLSFAEETLRWRHDDSSEERQIVCYSDAPQQRVIGFGAALTEASAWVFAQMPATLQDEVLVRCFGPASLGGNAYTLCRTHLQSCDFARGNYAYVSRPRRGQDVLDTFTIERDRSLLIPFIRCCQALAPELSLVAAPWSPPAFMKTNRSMNHGGKLRARYADAWARVLARAVAAWRAEGIPIERLAVQNEPMATQTWDSCVYTAQEEAHFAAYHLKPALVAEGLDDVKLLAWDHNKERLVSRMHDMDNALAADGGLTASYAGAAFHWYTGDHSDAVRLARTLYPACELIHTEGCAAFSAGKGQTAATDAEHYAHDMIGDLNAGANGYIDWNILLDEQGGPNHVGNFCDAPLMYDRASERLIVNRSFDYIGHITRFVQPGARILPTSSHTDWLETLCALNPDGTHTLVILNRTARNRRSTVRDGARTTQIATPAHSIQTLIW